MRGQAWIVAGLIAVSGAAGAVDAAAQSYGYTGQGYVRDPMCTQEKQNRALIGGAIGGLAGAVLGRQVAARNARTEGMVLGGLAGAAAGAAIGHNSTNCQAQASTPEYGGYTQGGWGETGYGQGGYGGSPTYRTGAPDPELRGGPYAGGGGWSGGGADCRYGDVTTRDPSGREIRDRIYMCRGADGVWRPA
jgi:hypothetical protein